MIDASGLPSFKETLQTTWSAARTRPRLILATAAIQCIAELAFALVTKDVNRPHPLGFETRGGSYPILIVQMVWLIINGAVLTLAFAATLDGTQYSLPQLYRDAGARFWPLVAFYVRIALIATVPLIALTVGVLSIMSVFKGDPGNREIPIIEAVWWIAIIAVVIRYGLPLVLAWSFALMSIALSHPPPGRAWRTAFAVAYGVTNRLFVGRIILTCMALGLAALGVQLVLMHIAMWWAAGNVIFVVTTVAGAIFSTLSGLLLVAAWKTLIDREVADVPPAEAPRLNSLIVPYVALCLGFYAVLYPHNDTHWRNVQYTSQNGGKLTYQSVYYADAADCNRDLRRSSNGATTTFAVACDRPAGIVIGWP